MYPGKDDMVFLKECPHVLLVQVVVYAFGDSGMSLPILWQGNAAESPLHSAIQSQIPGENRVCSHTQNIAYLIATTGDPDHSCIFVPNESVVPGMKGNSCAVSLNTLRRRRQQFVSLPISSPVQRKPCSGKGPFQLFALRALTLQRIGV